MVAAPCLWDVEIENCNTYDSLEIADQVRVRQMAVEFLWNWTGRVFGLCEVALRPCRENCGQTSAWNNGKMLPVLLGGRWFNLGCARCGNECGCSYTPALHLPGPIDSITEVLIDGQVLPPAAYRVDDSRFLQSRR